jgi:hypothetical protein
MGTPGAANRVAGLKERGRSMKLEIERSCRPVSAARIAEFEAEHHVVLPADYRRFLQTTNGGFPADPGVVFGRRRRSLDYFFPLLDGPESDWNEMDIEAVLVMQEGLVYTGKEYGIDLVPVAYLSGGDLICLDCAKSPPEVVEFFHEHKPNEKPSFKRISKGFTHFLKSLKADEDGGDYLPKKKVPPVDVIREVAGVPVVVRYEGIEDEFKQLFEPMMGLQLPDSVWAFLEQYNGFYPQRPLGFDAPRGTESVQLLLVSVPPGSNPIAIPSIIDPFFFGETRIMLDRQLFSFTAGYRNNQPTCDLVQLMRCESGNWVCIDIRPETYGQVVLVRPTDSAFGSPAYDYLAPDFPAFLQMLRAL